MQWNEITTLEEWNAILEKSSERGQVILKHSTTCPVSSNALSEFESYLKRHQTAMWITRWLKSLSPGRFPIKLPRI